MTELFDLAQAVSAADAALETEAGHAEVLLDLHELQVCLDIAYEGARPDGRGTLDATASLLVSLARRMPRHSSVQRASVAIAGAFAAHHGATVRLTPLRQALAAVRAVQDNKLGQPEMATWLRGRALGVDPPLLAGERLPLRHMAVALVHAVSGASATEDEQNEEFGLALCCALTGQGAQLLRPLPRERGGLPVAGEALTDAQVRVNARGRLKRAGAVTAVLGVSAVGPCYETELALVQGLPVAVVLRAGRPVSAWLNRPGVDVFRYRARPVEAVAAVARWHVDNRWALMNAHRRRKDRLMLGKRRARSLHRAWTDMPSGHQDYYAGLLRTTPSDLDALLTSPEALCLLPHEQVTRLQHILRVPPPGTRLPAKEFDEDELDALAAVAQARGVSLTDAFQAANDLLVTLGGPGESRARMNTAALWTEYLTVRGLLP